MRCETKRSHQLVRYNRSCGVVARLCLRRRLGPLDCTGVLPGGKNELAGDGHGDEWTHLKPFLNRLETVFR